MGRSDRARLVVLSCLVGLLGAAIAARLVELQVNRSAEFKLRAAQQHRSKVTVKDPRGAILDREGRELAVSIETQALYAHPRRVADPERVATLLAPVLGVRRHELLSRLRSDKSYVYLKRFLDPETVAAVSALDLELGDGEALGFEPQPQRVYPRGRLGVHVVGYANIDGVGLEGIERQMDEALQGGSSVYLVLQDARNGRIRRLVRPAEKRPMDVVSTIDLVLQHIVERELDAAMAETAARAATGILLDPDSGQILALANRPAADPNEYAHSRPDQRINRALVHFYEPGSTFKFVPMAAALEHHVIRPNQVVFCENGSYHLGSRWIHDVSRRGNLTPAEVIAYSSNIGMVKITRDLAPEALADMIGRFGFGRATGIELPGESDGLVTPVSRWSAFSKASLSFGQEIGVTPLQMVQAMAVVANGGVRHPARVVLGTRGPDGTFHRFAPPEPVQVLSASTARQLAGMLETVVEVGTGKRAAVDGYRLAGKSGTAQKALPSGGGYSETDYIASFAGFGPTSRPRVVAIVVLDSPRGNRHGGFVAAPVFSRIVADALRYLRVPTDDGVAPPPLAFQAEVTALPGSEAPAAEVATGGVVPDVTGMSLRGAIATLAAGGFRTRVVGRGRVVAQTPGAGGVLEAGGICALRLGEAVPEEPGARPAKDAG